MVGDSEPIAVLLTHGHCDHVSALDEICEYYNIPAYLHPLDQELLQLIDVDLVYIKRRCTRIVKI